MEQDRIAEQDRVNHQVWKVLSAINDSLSEIFIRLVALEEKTHQGKP